MVIFRCKFSYNSSNYPPRLLNIVKPLKKNSWRLSSRYGRWAEQTVSRCRTGATPKSRSRLPDVVHHIGEPTRVKRPGAQVAHDLGFYLLHRNSSFLGQIWAEVFGAKCWQQFGREPFFSERSFEVNNLRAEFQVFIPKSFCYTRLCNHFKAPCQPLNRIMMRWTVKSRSWYGFWRAWAIV